MSILYSVIPSLKIMAENNDILAQFEYGDYLNSYGQTEIEKQEGFNYLRNSALKNFVPSYYLVANCYYNGKGVEKNYEKAVEWYTKAAEQGNSYAQNDLGNCYYNGKGVEKNDDLAVNWLRKSAKQENENAKKDLIGKNFKFGKYDGNALRWRVLNIENDIMYVLCETIICDKAFYNSGNDWNKSTLRKWLNEEFYKNAFDNEEKECIKEVNSDKVTLLSKEEAEKLMTQQERSLGSYWWLRSASPRDSYDAWIVYSGGSLSDAYVIGAHGVRPALNLKL